MSRILASRLPLLAFVALAGCATVPEEVPEIWPDDADADVPAASVPAAPVPAAPAAPAAPRADAPPPAPVVQPAPPPPARKFRVCLDPGHGGIDSGAVSKDGKTEEKSISLDIAKRAARKLRDDGFEVMLTRTDDATAVELADRADAARRWRADAFVSVHLNSAEGGSARGIETYRLTPQGMESTVHRGPSSAESKMRFPGNANDRGNAKLAECVHRRLVRAAGSATEDRGLKLARWIVLREARCPAVLVECGFVSSAKDLAWLRSESGREAAARGICEGIRDFASDAKAQGLPAKRPSAPAAPTAAPAPAPRPAQPSAVPPPAPPPPALERVSAPLPERPLDAAPGVSAARAAALRAAGLDPVGAGHQTTETKKK